MKLNINIIAYSLNFGGSAIAANKFRKLLPKNFSVEAINQDNAGRLQFLKRLLSFFLGKLGSVVIL